jgi:hypothetical protein
MICDSVVVAEAEAVSSRSMSICDADTVVDAIMLSISRNTSNAGADVAVVADNAADISRSSSKSDADVAVADAIAADISRRIFSWATVVVVAAACVVISRNTFVLADDNTVDDAIVATSSRNTPPAVSVGDSPAVIYKIVLPLSDPLSSGGSPAVI